MLATYILNRMILQVSCFMMSWKDSDDSLVNYVFMGSCFFWGGYVYSTLKVGKKIAGRGVTSFPIRFFWAGPSFEGWKLGWFLMGFFFFWRGGGAGWIPILTSWWLNQPI